MIYLYYPHKRMLTEMNTFAHFSVFNFIIVGFEYMKVSFCTHTRTHTHTLLRDHLLHLHEEVELVTEREKKWMGG